MNPKDKTKAELIKDLEALQQENDALKILRQQDIAKLKYQKKELIVARNKLSVLKKDKEDRAELLNNANKELRIKNKEIEKRASDLIYANKELLVQKNEKEKRAAKLNNANKELAVQKKEKEDRATELLIANQKLALLNDEKEKRTIELMSANKELEQFAYVASHDLQEPLRTVSSYTQLLERRYKDKLDADANLFIYYAVDGANRMQILINDLLSYTRISSQGKQFTKVDISQLLENTISNLQQLIIENTAGITFEDMPVLQADESQISRLFQNLIENAIKYKQQSEFPCIHISCKKLDNFYQFAVKDNGIGIDMQFHDRIFIIFQRLHTKDQYPGTGIGLSICKRIVERHGGKIWFESKPGEGSTFYFTLKA